MDQHEIRRARKQTTHLIERVYDRASYRGHLIEKDPAPRGGWRYLCGGARYRDLHDAYNIIDAQIEADREKKVASAAAAAEAAARRAEARREETSKRQVALARRAKEIEALRRQAIQDFQKGARRVIYRGCAIMLLPGVREGKRVYLLNSHRYSYLSDALDAADRYLGAADSEATFDLEDGLPSLQGADAD